MHLLGGMRGRLRSSRSPVHNRVLLLLLLSRLLCMLRWRLLHWHVLALHGLACWMQSCACRKQDACACGISHLDVWQLLHNSEAAHSAVISNIRCSPLI